MDKLDPTEVRQWASRLESDDNTLREDALEAILSHVKILALDQTGCRVVQRALEISDRTLKSKLAQCFKGEVISIMISKYGNFVLQKIVEELPPVDLDFLIAEILLEAHKYARHEYGCRVFCRIIEHTIGARPRAETLKLVEFLTREDELKDLIENKYGNYVIRTLLDHGPPAAQEKIAEALHGSVLQLAKHEYGTFVVEAVLGKEKLRNTLLEECLATPNAIQALLSHNRGRHIVNTMKEFSDEVKKVASHAEGSRSSKTKVVPKSGSPINDINVMAAPSWQWHPYNDYYYATLNQDMTAVPWKTFLAMGFPPWPPPDVSAQTLQTTLSPPNYPTTQRKNSFFVANKQVEKGESASSRQP